MKSERAEHLSSVKRVVIKIGSSLLADPKKKGIKTAFLRHLAGQIKTLQKRGLQCLVVTSGAIAAGLFELGLDKKPKEIEKLQALAAIGQSKLMHAYEVVFKKNGLKVAQILLTREDMENRQRYSNAHNTVMELLRHKIIPVVNENDTVAVEEIKFGNNDILGTLVAHLSQADLLVLLTDKDGLFSEDPALNPKARLISGVRDINKEIERGASRSRSLVGTGGMQAKIQAAKNMMLSGVPMVIANGRRRDILNKIMAADEVGTFFFPMKVKMSSRKNWLAWSVNPKGEIVVDDGARRALIEMNKSLLPTGIQKVLGHWDQDDIIKITDSNGLEIARGLSNFSSRDLELVKGLRTQELHKKLGRKTPDEAVHRDNMVKLVNS